MSIDTLTNQITELRERLTNINQAEKSRETEKEVIKEELRKLILQVDATAEAESEEMQQAAQQLQADIEKAEAEKERQEADLQKNRALLRENINSRIKAAGKVDTAIKTLADTIEKYLSFASDTDNLAAAAQCKSTAAAGVDRAKVAVSDSVRAGMNHLDLPYLSIFVPISERMSFAENETRKMSFYSDIQELMSN